MSSITTVSRMLINNLSKRGITQCQPNRRDKKRMLYAVRRTAFNLSGYNRFGLYTHDVINHHLPVVREALRRLPKDVLDARNFRIIRALQLDFLRTWLPNEKWITYEQDIQYRYLDLYMKEIEDEQAEIHDFGCLNYRNTDWPADDIK